MYLTEAIASEKGENSMNELIKVEYTNDRPTVLGRDLHAALGVQTAYKDWFPRMCEYGFAEGADFNPLNFERVQSEGGRTVTRVVTDHQLTVAMAKELCMLQRTEKGKQCRQYFIQIEDAWNQPAAVMARALQMANRMVEQLKQYNFDLSAQNAIMAPKAEYFDAIVDRNLLTNFRDTSKELHIGQRTFVDFLLEGEYVYRDPKGKLLPYAQHVKSGLFELKECVSDKTKWSGTQTLITPKGRETFRLLMRA